MKIERIRPHSVVSIDPARSAQMARVKGKNTKPEFIVRSLVDGLRIKYKTYVDDLPGQPDLVFLRRRKIIFVHGCFWHQHRKVLCWRSRLPKTRLDFWRPKLTKNVLRDKSQIAALRRAGWKVLVLWECETTISKRRALARKIEKFLTS